MTDTLRTDLGPFVVVPTWLITAVSPGALAQWIFLASMANNATHECWPGKQRIADETDTSIPTVKRRNAELVAAGAMRIEERQREDGSQTSNMYVLQLAQPLGGHPRSTGGVNAEPPGGSTLSPELDSLELDSLELKDKSARAEVEQQQIEGTDPETECDRIYTQIVKDWPKKVYGTEETRQRTAWRRMWRHVDDGTIPERQLSDAMIDWLDTMRAAHAFAEQQQTPKAQRYRPTTLGVWCNQERWRIDPATIIGGWLP